MVTQRDLQIARARQQEKIGEFTTRPITDLEAERAEIQGSIDSLNNQIKERQAQARQQVQIISQQIASRGGGISKSDAKQLNALNQATRSIPVDLAPQLALYTSRLTHLAGVQNTPEAIAQKNTQFAEQRKQGFGPRYSRASAAIGGGVLGQGDQRGFVASTSTDQATATGRAQLQINLTENLGLGDTIGGYATTTQPEPPAPTPQRTARATKFGSAEGRAGPAIQKQLEYQASLQRPEGITSFTSTKTLGSEIPGRADATFSPFKTTTLALFEGAPPTPPRLSQAQVDALSDAEYQNYLRDVENYNDYVRQQTGTARQSNRERAAQIKQQIANLKAQGIKTVTIGSKTVPLNRAYREIAIATREGGEISIIPGISAEARQINIQNAAELKRYVKDVKAAGVTELVISAGGERKTVPVERAYREFIIAKRTDPNASVFATGGMVGPVRPEPTVMGSLVSFGGKPSVTLADYLQPAKKSVAVGASELGLGFGFTPFGLPKLPGPKIGDRQYGTEQERLEGAFVPAETFGKQLFALPEGFRREITEGFGGGQKYYEKEVEPSFKPTGIGSTLSGIPSGRSRAYQQGTILGEAALFFTPTTFGKGFSLAKGVAEIQIGLRQATQIGKAIAKQAPDVPFGVFKTKAPKVFEFAQGLEPARTTRPSPKIEPALEIERIGKTVEAKYTKLPKEIEIPPPVKEPTVQTPSAFIGTEKGGVTATIRSEPIRGEKEEIGAIIRGELSRAERKRLGAELVSAEESTAKLYAVRARPGEQASEAITLAEKSDYLRRITDITLQSTKQVRAIVDRGEIRILEKVTKRPTTIGYFETAVESGRQKGFSTFRTPVGSTPLDKYMARIGLSTGKSSRTFRPMKPLTLDEIAAGKIGGGATGKGKALSKESEDLLKGVLPNLISGPAPRAAPQFYSPLNVVYPGGTTEIIDIDYGRSILEPQSITKRRPTTVREPMKLIEQFTPQIKINIAEEIGQIGKIGTSRISQTIQKQPQTPRFKPLSAQIPKVMVGTTPALGLTPLQTPKQTPALKPTQIQVPKQIIVPDIKIPPPMEPPPTRFPPFGRGGGFPFLIPGGRGSGPLRARGYSRKAFVAEPVDPLRAGVIAAEGVEQLKGYTTDVFKQIDRNLARARKRAGASGGINQPLIEFKGIKGKGIGYVNIKGFKPGRKTKGLLNQKINIKI